MTDNEQVVNVQVTVNGVDYDLIGPSRLTLADMLRDNLGLTGTHLGCEHGVCGACTVLVDGEPVRSCLILAVQTSDRTVLTIEGVAVGGQLHPVQQAFWANHAMQCGFCTPGMVISSIALLQNNPAPSEREVREYLSGNICRCTGYQNIVAAVMSVRADTEYNHD